MPNVEPSKYFLRWGEMVDWLRSKGLSVRSIKRLKKAGKIKSFYLSGGNRAMYLKIQIMKDVLNEI